ncbi:MAG: hypothetical protein DMG07_20660 [Acidobacteria bacterium]|nr:MAG: hypothetical protein DMG07_20660 [Acidobacteriota bacterium]
MPPPVRQARSGWLLSPKGPTPLGRVDVVIGPAPSSHAGDLQPDYCPGRAFDAEYFFRVPAIATRRPAPCPSWEQGACREIFALRKLTMLTTTDSNQWFAIHVRPRFEKLIASSLLGKGYESFLPLYKTRSRWSDRMKDIDRPLFPGYLFCRLDLEHRLPLLVTPGVIQIVGIGKTPHAIEEGEILAIQAVVASGFQAEPWPFLRVGQRVRIDRGPLADVEGILLATRAGSRLVVSVTLLQRSVAVEIDSAWVTPVEPAKARPALGALKPVRR